MFAVNREGCDLRTVSVSYYNLTWFRRHRHTHLWPGFDLHISREQRVPVWFQSQNISRSDQMVFNKDPLPFIFKQLYCPRTDLNQSITSVYTHILNILGPSEIFLMIVYANEKNES